MFSRSPSDRTFKIRYGLACFVAILVMSHHDVTADFRTLDGSGNHPTDTLRGAAGTRFIRFQYGTHYGDLLGDELRADLPNPRIVSNTLNAQSTSVPNAYGLSDWVVQWGQFLSHDLSLSPVGGNGNVLSDGTSGDFSIPILEGHDPLGPHAIPFSRSDYHSETGQMGPPIVPREQLNATTAYIDASHIYSSDATRAAALRTFTDGLLATSTGDLLPLNTAGFPNEDPFDQGPAQYLAGDVRANQQYGLTATHVLFVREHNRLAGLLQDQDPSRTDEQLYQLARKIVGAEMQAITYNEYLPALLGEAAPAAADFGYDLTVDASITNSFATAFFRFGHTAQSSSLQLVNETGQTVGEVTIEDAFFDPEFLQQSPGNTQLVLKGLASQLAQEHDLLIVDALRNRLFGPPGAGGLDLAALDIQRGRDHGLPGYNSLRNSYGLPLLPLSQVSSDPATVQALRDLYGSANDIDAWIGALAEDHLPGSSVGQLLTTVLAHQFERLRDGDRMFYTGDPDLRLPDVTAVIDLSEVSLSHLIRWNTDIVDLQDNVFFAIPEPSAAALALVGLLLPVGLIRFKSPSRWNS